MKYSTHSKKCGINKNKIKIKIFIHKNILSSFYFSSIYIFNVKYLNILWLHKQMLSQHLVVSLKYFYTLVYFNSSM